MSQSTIPFCLRTDRSVWIKCVHCSTFPLCIQSNMSPPLTEHTGIGCMMMIMTGAQTQPAIFPDQIRTVNQTVSSDAAPALRHNPRANLILRFKVMGEVPLFSLVFFFLFFRGPWVGVITEKANQPAGPLNWLRQATPWLPHWLELITWWLNVTAAAEHVVPMNNKTLTAVFPTEEQNWPTH